jgi:hypothetical protein
MDGRANGRRMIEWALGVGPGHRGGTDRWPLRDRRMAQYLEETE